MHSSLAVLLVTLFAVISLHSAGADYVDTCQDIAESHATLFAECTNDAGQLQRSTLDLTTCLTFTSGQLVCDDHARCASSERVSRRRGRLTCNCSSGAFFDSCAEESCTLADNEILTCSCGPDPLDQEPVSVNISEAISV